MGNIISIISSIFRLTMRNPIAPAVISSVPSFSYTHGQVWPSCTSRQSSQGNARMTRREENFWQQHYNDQRSDEAIQRQMRLISMVKERCKPKNTIIHDSPDKIRDICTNPNSTNVRCRNGSDNCYEGPNPFSVTVCEDTGSIYSVYPNCQYNCHKEEPVKVTVACENGKPVHFDAS
uniref:Ribonuclease pancreatic-like n=1 Tax=Monodelphis domestica TaxID=13616 RepID=K7E690_MONDO